MLVEWLSDAPYRRTIDLQLRLRRKDGTVVSQRMTDWQPVTYGGKRGPDLNRLGRMLEDRNLVSMVGIGNAAVRRYSMRQMLELGLAEFEKDPNLLRTPEGKTRDRTALTFGTMLASPPMPDGAGRLVRRFWSVMDESKFVMPA